MTRIGRLLIGTAALMALTLPARETRAQMADFGDAPEDAMAYPWLGVNGLFPTCLGGPVGFIAHRQTVNQITFFGPSVDFEVDGNAGVCPPPAYELDECWGPADGDGGVTFPSTYTIVGAAPQLCSQAPATAMGFPCTPGVWGMNLDAMVTNNAPFDVYLNVIVDWDQSGAWGGGSLCGALPAPERILTNFVVPSGFSGLVSALAPPNFRIGPKRGFVWMRLTMTEVMIPFGFNWNGAGAQALYDVGETEDVLVVVGEPDLGQGEYGDAPENALAYPPTGVLGRFPTCTGLGLPNSFIRHNVSSGQLYFGLSLDAEPDGNTGDCLWGTYDRDECNSTDGDAGLLLAGPHTIVGGLIVACPGSNGQPLGNSCAVQKWGLNVDIEVHNLTNRDMFMNALGDWDQDGVWGGNGGCAALGAAEWYLRNFVIPPGFSGPLSLLMPPDFVSGLPGFVWCRFTLSDQPVATQDWDGHGVFTEGETEDYLLTVQDPAGVTPELRGGLDRGLLMEAAAPNPFTPSTRIAFTQPLPGPVRATVHDLQGRLVARVLDGFREAGRHEVTWDGTGLEGRPVGAGFYILRLEAGGEVRTQKLIRSR